MLFQSQVFILCFLPLTLAGYYFLRDSRRARENVLLAASLVFYAWWDARFLPLFLVHTAVAWGAAKLCERDGRSLWIDIGVGLQLLSLATFKYADFLIGLVEQAGGVQLPRSGIILPIGISFFTFQLISYMVDVRRGQSHAYAFRDVLLYIAFFPQLVAGPIVRHQELLPQFAPHPLRAGWEERIGKGLILFILGFAKKVLLADNLAPLADPAFATGATPGFWDAWAAALAFSFQLFLDFSAYSEMAIGLGLMFGVILPENFRTPYRAADIQDFWRRWHITLSSFFRDYVYKPLGGNPRGNGRERQPDDHDGPVRLWHGAGITYVAWGLLHGAALVAHRLWRGAGLAMPFLPGWALTMLFVVVGWVLFRAPDFATAGRVLAGMAGVNGMGAAKGALWLLPVAAAVCIAMPSSHELAERWLKPHYAVALASVAVFVVCLLQVGSGQPVNFIYFQF